MTGSVLRFTCKYFEELTLHELYEIMVLRQVVFAVEQDCPYLDADGKDLKCWHLMGRNEAGKLFAYARLLPEGVSYPGYASIGRVVSSPEARGMGAGRQLMQAAMAQMPLLFPSLPIRIGAQQYLIKFYESFGFQIDGEMYLEDGIPHVEMVREHNAAIGL
ncbi:MAG: GNAT family N-acetyltransferase [Saprospiraceae bacterium]|nr:GNAT family N-acetyltransferase [Saprospiraceae bacterium]MDZ4702458.1 GNAT family N-acetyltransferase [Saprospiraceae bacterium]